MALKKLLNLDLIYKAFVFQRRLLKLSPLKLSRIFHLEKINQIELVLKPEDKCLLLSPHFDDETFGCGGLLIKNPENFDIICLTDSAKCYDNCAENELNEIRKKEFFSVMETLGITSFKFLDIPDGELINHYMMFSQINIEAYDFIFLPNYYDDHKDHKAVTIMLQKLLSEKKYKKTVKFCFYEIWSALVVPNYFVDITKIIEQKRKLISIYRSQLEKCNFIKAVLSLNTYRGVLVNVGWAEMYTVVDLKTFLKL